MEKIIKEEKYFISGEDKVLIDKVVDKFSKYSATDLVKLTQHQTPQIDAINSKQNGEIAKESILEYFKTFQRCAASLFLRFTIKENDI